MQDNFFFFFFFFFFFHWHYNPLWALACGTMAFHFSYLPPTLSIFSLPALEDLFLLPLSIFFCILPFFSSLSVLEWRFFWASYLPPFSPGDLTSLSFALLHRTTNSYNKSQQDALFLNFILVKNCTCFGQIYCPTSGVLILYSQQMVFVIQVMLPSASREWT